MNLLMKPSYLKYITLTGSVGIPAAPKNIKGYKEI